MLQKNVLSIAKSNLPLYQLDHKRNSIILYFQNTLHLRHVHIEKPKKKRIFN